MQSAPILKSKTKKQNIFKALSLAIFVFLMGVGASTTVAAKYEPVSTFISEVKNPPIAFTSVAVAWDEEEPLGTEAEIFIRFQNNEGWTEWQDLHPSIDKKYENENVKPTAFITTDISSAYQYKVELSTENQTVTPKISNIEITFVHAHDAKEIEKLDNTVTLADSENLSSRIDYGLDIITRNEWGANEGLRVLTDDRPEEQLASLPDDFYEKYAHEMKIIKEVAYNANGEELTWPLEYPEEVSKIIVHHTATTKDLDNPEQAIRDIYYYHAITRGWGDIGYNYLIDPMGRIYEGRYGGDGVVAAHAGGRNVGSIGIALLGNYHDGEPTTAAISSLTALIKAKSGQFSINTTGYSSFRGDYLPNIIGHRDVGSTTCPGDQLYDMLPRIRVSAKDGLSTTFIDRRRVSRTAERPYDYDLEGTLKIPTYEVGLKQSISVTFKNTGTQSWGPETYVMFSKNNFVEQYLGEKSTTQSAVIGKEIKPGETHTFTIPFVTTYQSGFSTMEIFMMLDGSVKVEKYLQVPLQVKGANYDYQTVDVKVEKPTLKSNEKTLATVILENTGSTMWKNSGANKIALGTENPRDHVSRLIQDPSSRIALMVEDEVAPGEKGTFKVRINAPIREGYYREYFAPVIEGVTWLPSKGNYIDFYVSNTTYKGEYASDNQAFYFDPGEKRTITFNLKNIGQESWFKKEDPKLKINMLKSKSLGVAGVIMKDDEVKPGSTGTVQMTVTAPEKQGTFRIVLKPEVAGESLFLEPMTLFIRVGQTQEGLSVTVPIIPFTKATQAGTNDLIRIGLSFQGDPMITATGKYKLIAGGKEKATFDGGDLTQVVKDGTAFKVVGSGMSFLLSEPPKFVPEGNSYLMISNYENRPSWKPELNDNIYKGTLEVHEYNDDLVVVNELPLEDYLYGLAEISATDPNEKIKAVIVLARSYALYYMTQDEKFPGAPFHLSDDPERSQKYLGYGFEKRNPTGVKAVKDTEGMVVTFNDKVIKTPYHSTNAGATKSALEVWGWNHTPYLVGVKDPGCEGLTPAGHGVGLSGCGSKYWAEQGKSYQDIIKYYFKGVEVEKR